MKRLLEILVLLIVLTLFGFAEKTRMHTVPPDFAQTHLIHHVDPVLPAHAKVSRGKVTLHVIISPAGDVSSAKIVSGDRKLASAAIKAVKQWKYQAFMENGVAIPVATDVAIEFPVSH